MPKRGNIQIAICIIFAMFLFGCAKEAPKESDLTQLTRVDVEKVQTDGQFGEVVMITDHETIDALRTIFKRIQWEPNVEPKMARKNDVKATLFIRYDKNMPERLVEYRIWFNQSNHSATIISNNKSEGYGTLDKKHARSLESILRK